MHSIKFYKEVLELGKSGTKNNNDFQHMRANGGMVWYGRYLTDTWRPKQCMPSLQELSIFTKITISMLLLHMSNTLFFDELTA